MPAAGELGAAGCPAFDVQAVCSGFVYGLAVAVTFVRAGEARNALVVGTEVFSRILDWSDRATCVLFGDGAGAVVLRADERPGVRGCVLHADGRHAGVLAVPGNVCGGKVTGHAFVRMDGHAVFRLAVRVLEEAAREVVAKCGMTLADVLAPTPRVQVEADAGASDLNVIGFTVEEALAAVDRALDRALVAGARGFRVIHGRGTGALGRAVRERLAAAPHVREVQPEGDAATWIDLG